MKAENPADELGGGRSELLRCLCSWWAHGEPLTLKIWPQAHPEDIGNPTLASGTWSYPAWIPAGIRPNLLTRVQSEMPWVGAPAVPLRNSVALGKFLFSVCTSENRDLRTPVPFVSVTPE